MKKKLILSTLFLTFFVLSISLIGQRSTDVFSDAGGSGCNNQPDNNNGDCTYATGEDGGNTYFCENSWAWHDCVK